MNAVAWHIGRMLLHERTPLGGVMALAATLAAAAAMLALPASAAPTQVTLSLSGMHPLGQEAHQGTFTASGPLCSSGSWLGSGEGTRVFTCSDQSGTFTASFAGELEHTAGATGPWSITSGSGPYTTLRGKGSGHIDSNSGGSTPPITFNDTWTGVVDFDATAPTGSITAAKVVRPHRAHGLWKVRVSFAAHDSVDGGPVSFHWIAASGTFAKDGNGTVTTGTGSFTFAFRRSQATHLLQIQISLQDPVGNESSVKKNVRLR